MDEIISLFIDDEMTVDQKMVFVKQVHGDEVFTRLTLDLLHQESLLRAAPVVPPPAVVLPEPRRRPSLFRFRWAAPFAAGLAAALLLVFLWLPGGKEKGIAYRFVIYQPDAQSVAVTGSFTDWRAAPMERAGQGGYWEVVLDIPPGEHRFSYILDDGRQMPDPTIPIREPDDFGGVNSILNVEVSV